MPRCIKCNYLLVLLAKRSKYKCSKCSSLFLQKDIDNKEFRYWNKRQRLTDIENYKPERKPRIKLSEEERKRRAKKCSKKWRDKIREQDNKRHREYWTKNSKHLNFKRKERYNLKREQVLNYQKQWQESNPYNYRIRRRLSDLREQQKQLALQLCKNKQYKLYINKIQKVLPTFVLSELLVN